MKKIYSNMNNLSVNLSINLVSLYLFLDVAIAFSVITYDFATCSTRKVIFYNHATITVVDLILKTEIMWNG